MNIISTLLSHQSSAKLATDPGTAPIVMAAKTSGVRAPARTSDGYSAARTIGVAALLISVAVCVRGLVGWWAVLPLWVLQAELMCRLFDAGVLGRASHSTPETTPVEEQTFTWEEVAARNGADAAWIAIDDIVYDVTDFVDRHPGGREMLLLAVGRDATNLFNSYHPFTNAPRALLARMRIGTLATHEHPTYAADSGFYREAAAAVKAYFVQTGLDRKNPWTGVMRMSPVYVVFAGAFWGAFCKDNVHFGVRVALAVLLGCCQGMPLTGWMHDASHASIGRSERWWWNVGRIALDYVSGSSMLSWRNQHVIGHHVYTNVLGADPDLPVKLDMDPRRLVEQQRWRSFYRYQHLYLLPLYGILGLKSRLQDVTEVFASRTNGPVRVNPISTQDYLRMLSGKCVFVFYRLVVPWTFCNALTGMQMFALFMITEWMTGYWLAFNFQVSHISSDADFLFSDTEKRKEGKSPGTMSDEWAVAQVTTTVDYAHGSAIAAYLSGALNYQTVHHLFPTVSQYHYPAITPIVMQVAEKHGVKFNVKKNFAEALSGHISHLREMGKAGIGAELKLE